MFSRPAGYEPGAFRRAIVLLISFVLLLVGMTAFAAAQGGQAAARAPSQELSQPSPRALLRASANHCVLPPSTARGAFASSAQEDSAAGPAAGACSTAAGKEPAIVLGTTGIVPSSPFSDVARAREEQAFASRAPPSPTLA